MKKGQKMKLIKAVIILSIISFFSSMSHLNFTGEANSTMKISNICYDAQSTTGLVPPPNCGEGLDPSTITDSKIIEGVPAYLWHHGCGPTAAGMVIGYWDGKGFDELIDGDASTQTEKVNNAIASVENYNDYCVPIDYPPNLLPDKSEPPFGDEHDDNCIADFMKTSQSYSKNYYGWSWFTDVGRALKNYIRWRNPKYMPIVESVYWNTLTWERFCREINESHPIIFLVDTDGDGHTDHFITAIGYDSHHHYACYNTWDTNIHWYNFAGISAGKKWGIYGAVFCSIEKSPDTIPPEVNITKPVDGYLYVFGKERKNIGVTVILGKISIEVDAEDTDSDIEKVEIYIDDEIKAVLENEPYIWLWDEFSIGWHTIKAIAYDTADNTATDEQQVWILNI